MPHGNFLVFLIRSRWLCKENIHITFCNLLKFRRRKFFSSWTKPQNMINSEEIYMIFIVRNDLHHFPTWIKTSSTFGLFLFLFPFQIQLWDTAGQERFRKSMVQHYYRNVHAVVFVYDMTNLASFHSLPSWIEECKQHLLANDIPRILVGNKCDLRNAIQVPTDLAQKFADTHSMPLFETSAKSPNDNDHVEAIFMTLAHKLKSHKPLMLSQPPGSGEIHLKPEPKPAMTCWC